MTDIVDSSTRSQMMAGIKSKSTKPELMVRSHLHALGFRYRLHVRSLPGSPDLVLKRYKTIIFVNGCFWHRHKGCKLAYSPKSNLEEWHNKFEANMKRDQKNIQALLALGWQVIILWECGLRRNQPFYFENLETLIRSNRPNLLIELPTTQSD